MDKNKIDLITEIANKKKRLDEVTNLLNNSKIIIDISQNNYLHSGIGFVTNTNVNPTAFEAARYLQPALSAWLNQQKDALEKELEELLS